MALSTLQQLIGQRLRESADAGGAGGGGGSRPTPAEVNAQRNRERLARIAEIGNTADGRRARELSDTDGERVVGRFQGGELDDSPAAREVQAEREDDLARQALDEQREREEEAQRLEEDEARRLQAEGGGEPGADDDEDPTRRGAGADDGAEEKVIDGVRYYRTIVAGSEKWLTLKELREGVARGIATEDTLRRAQEALASASQSQERPKPPADEVPDEKDLENIILSANLGDEEAVRKLVSVLRARPAGPKPEDVSRLVSQQIATQREVDRAEADCADLLGDENLAPVFKQRLTAFAREKPNTRIGEAYQAVAGKMRKDFAAMLLGPDGKPRTPGGRPPPPASKLDRKRQIVTPPRGAGRQPAREDADREVPVSEQIDAMARARGQVRAHRIRRS